MRILFVALAQSVHTARWIRQLVGQGHELHLFSPLPSDPLHQELYGHVTYHPKFSSSSSGPGARGVPLKLPLAASVANILSSKLNPEGRARRLAALIRKLKPDIVHSMEMQGAGYLCLEVKERLGNLFPFWMVSNWGSDIFLYGRLAEHRRRLNAILAQCDFYLCECRRDVILAQNLGLRTEGIAVIAAGGGMPLSRLSPWRATPPSRRRRVLLKGYQGWAGRAFCGLAAMELVVERLRPYEIVIYAPDPDVVLRARLLAEDTGLEVRTVPSVTHDNMMKLHGQARTSLGLSISDGASTSFLEAIAMGSFPIQSHTACADEWIADGSTGLLVPPEDPRAVAEALVKALTDDALVDEAARINAQTIAERLSDQMIQAQAIALYQSVEGQLRSRVL